MVSGSAVTSRSGAILKNPVLREEWELNNDDVELLEKIGRGNFGDVYKANLRQAIYQFNNIFGLIDEIIQ